MKNDNMVQGEWNEGMHVELIWWLIECTYTAHPRTLREDYVEVVVRNQYVGNGEAASKSLPQNDIHAFGYIAYILK